MLELKSLSAGYEKGTPVLKDISFRIERGQLVSFLAANGAGKTTLLMTISRQLKALGGEIYIGEKRIDEFSGKEISKKIAVLFTKREADGSETVFETVAKGRYPYTGWFGRLSDRDRAKVTEALASTDCLELKDRIFDSLSDGQKQRVLIARAVAQETEILIIDEPTGYLDLKYQVEIMELLRKLSRERNITVLVSIHEIALAAAFSDELILLKDKKIYAKGKAKDVLNEETIGKVFDIDRTVWNKLLQTIF